MSKHHTEIIKCPHCGNESEITIWDTINVELDPHLKEKVLRADIYRFICPVKGIMVSDKRQRVSFHRFCRSNLKICFSGEGAL